MQICTHLCSGNQGSSQYVVSIQNCPRDPPLVVNPLFLIPQGHMKDTRSRKKSKSALRHQTKTETLSGIAGKRYVLYICVCFQMSSLVAFIILYSCAPAIYYFCVVFQYICAAASCRPQRQSALVRRNPVTTKATGMIKTT